MSRVLTPISFSSLHLGHVNHSLFWQNLAPSKNGGGELKDGALKDAIDRDFGGLDQLKTKFNAQLAGIQGSGWGWLGLNPATQKLDIITTANQDPLLCEFGLGRFEGEGRSTGRCTRADHESSYLSLFSSSHSTHWS